MMKGLKLFLICTIAFSSVAPALAKDKEPSRLSRFWQKHKIEIKAGVAIAALLGAAVGLAYHADKTDKAIEMAGIRKGTEQYKLAVKAVLIFGPLGPNLTLKIIKKAMETNDPRYENKKIMTAKVARRILVSKIGVALAYYFGENLSTDKKLDPVDVLNFPLEGAAMLGPKRLAKATAGEVMEGLVSVGRAITSRILP